MKRGGTLFAKIVVILITIAALTLCLILLPELAREEMVGKPKSADITLPFLTTAYILATPFFYSALSVLQTTAAHRQK